MKRALFVVTLVLTGAVMPTTARATGRPTLIAWGAYGTAPQVKEHLDQWAKESAALADVLTLAPGYPRIASHEEFPELDAGRYVVLLGACPRRELDDPVNALTALSLEAFTLRTKVRVDPACPKFSSNWQHRESIRSPRERERFSATRYERTEPDTGATRTLVHLYLRDSRHVLVDTQAHLLDPGCTASLALDGEDIRVERTCAAGHPSDPLQFTVAGGKIVKAGGLDQVADLQAVVLAAPTTDAEAHDLLARWEHEQAFAGGLVALPAGFPRIVAPEDYSGLPAGTKPVLLALCPASRLGKPLEILKALNPHVQAFKVTARSGLPACPEPGTPPRMVQTVKAGNNELTLAIFAAEGDSAPWLLRLALRDPAGMLLDARLEDRTSAARSLQVGASCPSLPVVRKDPGRSSIRVDHACQLAVAETQSEIPFDVHVVYTAKGDRIVETARQTTP